MKPALSQVCSLHSPFEKDLEDFAKGACRAVELWLTKLETYLEAHTLDDVKRLLQELELAAPVASYQGGLLLSQGEARRETWAHFARRLELCRALRIETLVIAGDIHGPLTQQDLDRVRVSLIQAADLAAPSGVRLAFEFQGRAVFANNLQTAAALVEECQRPNLGLCLDVFHYYQGPSKFEDLALLHPGNLFHVQVSDVAAVPREFASDADRILPGDGDFQLAAILNALRGQGYDGYVAVELMNPTIWQIPPLQIGEVALTALRKVLGQAEMSRPE